MIIDGGPTARESMKSLTAKLERTRHNLLQGKITQLPHRDVRSGFRLRSLTDNDVIEHFDLEQLPGPEQVSCYPCVRLAWCRVSGRVVVLCEAPAYVKRTWADRTARAVHLVCALAALHIIRASPATTGACRHPA